MKIIITTQSQEKLAEIKHIWGELSAELVCPDAAICPDLSGRTGHTFSENALYQARAVCDATNSWTLAEAAGLRIVCLDGQPGPLTDCWAGADATDDEVIAHTLLQIQGIDPTHREAYFDSAVALVAPDGQEWVFTGRLDGRIAQLPRGEQLPGLPYHRLFIPAGCYQTMAEMAPARRYRHSWYHDALAKAGRLLVQAELIMITPQVLAVQPSQG